MKIICTRDEQMKLCNRICPSSYVACDENRKTCIACVPCLDWESIEWEVTDEDNLY